MLSDWPCFTWKFFMIWSHKILKLIFQTQLSCPRIICAEHWKKNYLILHEKPHFFSRCSEKIVFAKKSNWNMIFLVSSGKMIFLFPENMILFFRQKMNDLSQNIYMEIVEICYTLQLFWKVGLSKKIPLE